MFLKSYLELPLPWDRVRASMLRHPRPWLQGLAEAVARRFRDTVAERLTVEAASNSEGPRVNHV